MSFLVFLLQFHRLLMWLLQLEPLYLHLHQMLLQLLWYPLPLKPLWPWSQQFLHFFPSLISPSFLYHHG
uniref:Uncharacterized protein n=1 Tax=Rhizophora mucronata TaxID=61149 RepID=A0A2P2QHW4_RHIMU